MFTLVEESVTSFEKIFYCRKCTLEYIKKKNIARSYGNCKHNKTWSLQARYTIVRHGMRDDYRGLSITST